MEVRTSQDIAVALDTWLRESDPAGAAFNILSSVAAQQQGWCPIERAVRSADDTIENAATCSVMTRIHLRNIPLKEGGSFDIEHPYLIAPFVLGLDSILGEVTIGQAREVWKQACADFGWVAPSKEN